MHRALLGLASSMLAASLCLAAARVAFGRRIDSVFQSTIHRRGLAFLNLGWLLKGPDGAWPHWVDVLAQKPRRQRAANGELLVTHIHHATVLLQVDGLNILTDPVYSDRVGPEWYHGPQRIHQPGVRFMERPPIDALLISHDHFDHLDLPTWYALKNAFTDNFSSDETPKSCSKSKASAASAH